MAKMSGIRVLALLSAAFVSGTSAAESCPLGSYWIEPSLYKYVGCFADNTNGVRDLATYPKAAQDVAKGQLFLQEETPYTEARMMLCANACKSEDWVYMGLQWQAECYCSNTYGSQGELDMSKCDSTGDVSDAAGTDGLTGVADLCGHDVSTCGGANAVYALGADMQDEGFCDICTPGKHDHDADATSPCESCPSDTYQEKLGATDCRACPVGRTSVPGSTSADACCPVGFVGTQSSCSPCIAPYYDLDQSASTPCAPCPAGTFKAAERAACQACQVERRWLRVHAGANPSECQLCPAGFFSLSPAATECTPCSPGSFVAGGAESSESCTSCVRGQYDHDSSATSPCVPCQEGTYSASNSSTQCTSCPQGTTSPPAATSADDCKPAQRVYIGCYNEGPRFDTEVVQNMDVCDFGEEYTASKSRETCETFCANYEYMALSWENECR
jgi:hypothetical protein